MLQSNVGRSVQYFLINHVVAKNILEVSCIEARTRDKSPVEEM